VLKLCFTPGRGAGVFFRESKKYMRCFLFLRRVFCSQLSRVPSLWCCGWLFGAKDLRRLRGRGSHLLSAGRGSVLHFLLHELQLGSQLVLKGEGHVEDLVKEHGVVVFVLLDATSAEKLVGLVGSGNHVGEVSAKALSHDGLALGL